MDSLLELLDEVEGKVIIWANYVHDVEKIVAKLCDEYGPETVVQYYGATPQPQRQKAIKQFNRYQNFGDYGYIKERLKIS